MNTEKISDQIKKIPEFLSAASAACQRIAPAWPLDKSIAVNPWWKMRGDSIETVAARLQWLGNIKMHMDKSYYQDLWETQITSQHLTAASQYLGVDANQAVLLDYLTLDDQFDTWKHLGELRDQHITRSYTIPWRDEVIQQISQFCALYFQYPERMQYTDDHQNGFYNMWLDVVRQDKGIEILMSASGLNSYFKTLPNTITELFNLASITFTDDINDTEFTDYCHALLLDINGWSSWMANMAWQAELEQKNNNLIEQLLAVRLAWDIVLWQYESKASAKNFTPIKTIFINQIKSGKHIQKNISAEHRFAWVWQTALELSVQQEFTGKIHAQLKKNEKRVDVNLVEKNTPKNTYDLHAIFCIDVRSEPIRRALEQQNQSIKTSGFAGFFGLPLEYGIANSEFSRPQLPGLLKASIKAKQIDCEASEKPKLSGASSKILIDVANKSSADAAPSSFGVIEAKGLCKVIDLFKRSILRSKTKTGIESLMTQNTWTLTRNNQAMTHHELADLAAGVLNAMGITENFAKHVLLVGHASSTTNNPHAAGLDCGACGGQSGEINVKVLAQIINNSDIRKALINRGIDIPESTLFIGCLHNTTTDEIKTFDKNQKLDQDNWKQWLLDATKSAQKQRASSVGIHKKSSDIEINKQFNILANDWAQLRPEWGLSNNAAFIVAPRILTKDINLGGRSFLHDYNWKTDTHFSVLEAIITAPMVVTNWINLQYFASVADNQKYGSGNKLLHNVVGGNIGVFEGNGGDLRIGLPIQSVHDGKQWRHQPVRLHVYIAAPQAAIAEIILRHSHIAELVNNTWLYIFQIGDNEIRQFTGNTWSLLTTA